MNLRRSHLSVSELVHIFSGVEISSINHDGADRQCYSLLYATLKTVPTHCINDKLDWALGKGRARVCRETKNPLSPRTV